MMIADWVWKDNLPALLITLSHICHYTFSQSDLDAVHYGLSHTSLNNNHWFDYSLHGKQTFELQLCKDDDDTYIIFYCISGPDEWLPAVDVLKFLCGNTTK